MHHVQTLAAKRASRVELQSAIDDLGSTFAAHFADEEAYLERVGFAEREAHAQVHAEMLEKYATFARAFAAGKGTLPRGFLEFLNFWLLAHICGLDQRYAPDRLGSTT